MFFAGIITDSLMIDRLHNKWTSRVLFVFILAVSICTNIWPIGDPDLTKLYNWVTELTALSQAQIAAGTVTLPQISAASIVFVFFTLAVVILYLFVSMLYARIYTGEKSGQGSGRSVAGFFIRLPVLILFFMLVSIPGSFLMMILPLILFYLVPALYFAPNLVSLEKMNPIDALIQSYKSTRGIKFFIFWNMLTLFCLYQSAEWLFLLFLPNASNAGILLHGFFTAYFFLAFGRMNGIFYERIRIHTVPKTP